ncbi:beta-ketoacyl synthase [Frankia sp. AgPm24]|uniref:beta-ketoacyl synthase n=1 Tax=Frankia sp. AgPm24 TaxID=631128 RepID=UPI00200D35F6|nr:beta-ketoacyl synthase [Frankia sp. AgPm24]MCK9923612.1 beta-ketoacyl synthase [Frankia sp. AgPm24]
MTVMDHQPVAEAEDDLGFDGEPFDPTSLAGTVTPALPAPSVAIPTPTVPASTVPTVAAATAAVPAVPTATDALPTVGTSAGAAAVTVADMIRLLRTTTMAAHASALRAQSGLQRRALAQLGLVPSATPAGTTPAGTTPAETVATGLAPAEPAAAAVVLPAGPVRTRATSEGSFKPLARTDVAALDSADLGRLARAEIAAVFGPAYDQEGLDAAVLLTAGGPLLLAAVDRIEARGGRSGRGLLLARPALPAGGAATGADLTDADLVAAAAQAVRLFALYTGLHLCLPHAHFVDNTTASGGGADDGGPRLVRGGGTAEAVVLVVEIAEIDLVPRPWLRADVELRRLGADSGTGTDGELLARVDDLVIGLREGDGLAVGPARGGRPTAWLGRRNGYGDRALLSEFHMAHFCRGDQAIALGPEFAGYTGRKATRLPSGGLLLVDRVLELHGTRGEPASLAGGSWHITEYDAHADSWYFTDTANASMPNCVYMETSLQAALMVGYYLGATLGDPDAVVSLRNLGGSATVLREIDLRDVTIRQHSRLLSTTDMPGSSLQNFAYTLFADGEPFYEGETLFGYFSDAALANQTGLDAGKFVPTWLDTVTPRPATRALDVAARRADPAARLVARDHLALLDIVDVVDGGGRYGEGYLHAVRPIDPHDWFFARHFNLDPVIPGSLGVESVVQAMQEWLLDSPHAADIGDTAAFILPVGAAFSWKYRGQFLPTDGETRLEVHIKAVRRGPGRVRVTADASVWKPGLRIYEMTDIAVELREDGAAPW